MVLFDLDLSTIAQLTTAAIAAGFAFIKAVGALVKAFKKNA